MELIPIKNENKSPVKQLLSIFENSKEPFSIIMSNDFFNNLTKCECVKKDMYELNDPDYYAYNINESASIFSKTLLRIEIKFVNGVVVVIKHNKIHYDTKKTAEIIYYFE